METRGINRSLQRERALGRAQCLDAFQAMKTQGIKKRPRRERILDARDYLAQCREEMRLAQRIGDEQYWLDLLRTYVRLLTEYMAEVPK